MTKAEERMKARERLINEIRFPPRPMSQKIMDKIQKGMDKGIDDIFSQLPSITP